MATYRAKALLYLDDRLIQPGEEFESSLVPGRNWEPLDKAAKQAVMERFPKGVPQDPKAIGSGHPMAAIPDDWRDLSAPQIIALAKKLGATNKGTGRDQAVAHIEREIAMRAISSQERARDAA